MVTTMSHQTNDNSAKVPSEERLKDDLDMYDMNNDGLIDKDELKQYMKNTIFGMKDKSKKRDAEFEKQKEAALVEIAADSARNQEEPEPVSVSIN